MFASTSPNFMNHDNAVSGLQTSRFYSSEDSTRLCRKRFLHTIVILDDGRRVGNRSGCIRRAVVAWYRRWAEARLATIVERWWPRFGGREPYRLLIRDQRQRWGSCAPDGTLRFNWRLAMLRPDLAEYVVVHELAHLRVRNHSTEFWNLLSRAMPDAQGRRRRLREVGKSLPL